MQCLELALKCVQLFTKNQTHLGLNKITSDCGLSSALMKCRQLSRSNWITTKDLCNFRGYFLWLGWECQCIVSHVEDVKFSSGTLWMKL